MSYLLITLLCTPFTSPGSDLTSQAKILELRDVVREWERRVLPNFERICASASDRRFAYVGLATARARLAIAEGKREKAAEEWRKVVAIYEEHLKDIQEIRRDRESIKMAQGRLAEARASLAEAEQRPEVVIVELEKAIHFHKWRLRNGQLLLREHAMMKTDLKINLKHELKILETETPKKLQDIHLRLDAAKKLLQTLGQPEQMSNK